MLRDLYSYKDTSFVKRHRWVGRVSCEYYGTIYENYNEGIYNISAIAVEFKCGFVWNINSNSGFRMFMKNKCTCTTLNDFYFSQFCGCSAVKKRKVVRYREKLILISFSKVIKNSYK